jgi:hypothetical protein
MPVQIRDVLQDRRLAQKFLPRFLLMSGYTVAQLADLNGFLFPSERVSLCQLDQLYLIKNYLYKYDGSLQKRYRGM